jgi:hypothetical protein
MLAAPKSFGIDVYVNWNSMWHCTMAFSSGRKTRAPNKNERSFFFRL